MTRDQIKLIISIEIIFLTLFILIFVQISKSEHPCLVIPGNQFAFWQTANAFKAEINPYDVEYSSRLITHAYCKNGTLPEIVWSPPILHPLIGWYSSFEYQEFLSLNLFFSAALTLLAFLILSFRYELYQTPILLSFSRILILTSLPLYLMLICAPALPISLLGLSLFLFIIKNKKLTNSVIAGIGLGLSAVKPHAVFYVFILVLIYSIRKKSFRTLTGIALTILVLLTLAILKQPEILKYYLEALPSFPSSYQTPTINRIIFQIFNLPIEQLAYYGMIPVIFFIVYLSIVKLPESNYLIQISILLSIILAPYLWSYEFILFAPLAFHLLSFSSHRNQRLYFYVFLIGNILLILSALNFHMAYDVFYPILIAVGFLLAKLPWKVIRPK